MTSTVGGVIDPTDRASIGGSASCVSDADGHDENESDKLCFGFQVGACQDAEDMRYWSLASVVRECRGTMFWCDDSICDGRCSRSCNREGDRDEVADPRWCGGLSVFAGSGVEELRRGWRGPRPGWQGRRYHPESL